MRLKYLLLVLLSLQFFVSSLFADTNRFNGLFFEPSIGRNTYLMLNDTETLHQFQFKADAVWSYGYHPLEIRQTGTRVRGAIDHSLVLDFQAALGLLDWMQLGIDLPIVMVNKFQDLFAATVTGTSNHFDLGDLRAEMKFNFLNSCCSPVGFAFIPFITVPTGSDKHYVGATGVTGGGKVAIDYKPSEKFLLTTDLGYRVGKKVSVSTLDYQHRLLFGAGAGFKPINALTVFGEVNGETAMEHFMSTREMTPIEAVAGVKWDIAKTGVELKAGGGSCIVCGVEGARFRGVLGVGYRLATEKFKKMDDDAEKLCHDKFIREVPLNLFELRARCPRDPSEFDPKLHDKACLKYYDIQHYADLILRCPPSADKFNPAVHDAECEKVYNMDGFLSESERMNVYVLAHSEMNLRCPSNPADYNPGMHDAGCPKFYELGKSMGEVGKCPPPSQYVEGRFPAACTKIYDFFGITTDQTWNEFILMGVKDVAGDVVPKEGVVAIIGGEIRTHDPVRFDFNSTVLNRADKKIIKEIVDFINSTTSLKEIKVSGHADAIGSRWANEWISRERARIVIDEMKRLGLRRSLKIGPVGYGSSRPEVPNTTSENRARNRRVVFNIVFKKL